MHHFIHFRIPYIFFLPLCILPHRTINNDFIKTHKIQRTESINNKPFQIRPDWGLFLRVAISQNHGIESKAWRYLCTIFDQKVFIFINLYLILLCFVYIFI